MDASSATDPLRDKHPWLKITTQVEDYVAPDYYDRLLKEYSFSGKTDLDLFKAFLDEKVKDKDLKILELGCGTGRGTRVVLDKLRFDKLSLVDLSTNMMAEVKKKFSEYNGLEYIESDTLTYLKQTDATYDIIFSLWSYSHSFYQLIEKTGVDQGIKEARSILIKMFTENMEVGSELFLIHSDWLSDEQQILVKQWGRDMPDLYQQGKQGISKNMLDSLLQGLSESHVIEHSVVHYRGDPIKYASLEEALEVFINFHLESYFNDTEYIQYVFDDLSHYLSKFKNDDGTISISPACFIYKCKRI